MMPLDHQSVFALYYLFEKSWKFFFFNFQFFYEFIIFLMLNLVLKTSQKISFSNLFKKL
jgi:hypothetical protein